MLEDLINSLNHKTTTWPQRHIGVIEAVRDMAAARAADRPLEILDVGLGLALKGIGRQNGLGRYLIIKRIETALRRLPLPDSFYENFEAQEIAGAFAGVPHAMTLADINPKLLRITAAQLGLKPGQTVAGDLTIPANPAFDALRGRFDAAFCFATIGRLGSRENRANGMANVASFLKPGGILATDDLDRNSPFTPVEGHKLIFIKS